MNDKQAHSLAVAMTKAIMGKDYISTGENQEKTYEVKLIQTYVFPFEVKAKNRIEAEQKAKEFVENYNEADNFFDCTANSFEKEFYKITPVIKEKE